MERDDSRPYRFGPFTLDPHTRVLSRAGEPLRLSPKAYDLLAHLLESGGRALTKEELLDEVWPDAVVTENSLSQRIREIRAVLDDDPQDPDYVLTVPRVGYRFVAEVRRPAAAPGAGGAAGGAAAEAGARSGDTAVVEGAGGRGRPGDPRDSPQPGASAGRPPARATAPPTSRDRPAVNPWAVVAVTLAVLAALGLVWFRAADPDGDAPGHELVSTFPGEHRSPALSPDGTALAFIQDDANGVPQVWVKSLRSGDPLRVTSDPRGAATPVWAPEGARILYAVPGAGIHEVAPLGGPPRQVLESGTSPALSADGSTLAFERDGGIWVAGSRGESPRRLEGVPPRAYTVPYAPALSPDGSLVAFFRAELGPNGDLWLLPTAGGEARRLTSDIREGGSPSWTPDGRHVVYSSTRAGSRTLWRVPVDGGDPVALTTGAGDHLEPSVAATADRLAYTSVRNRWTLRVLDPATGEIEDLLQSRTGILWPVFSPDGQRIAFFGPDARGDVQIFVVDRDGSNLLQVTRGRGEMNTMPRWFPGGESLLFYQILPERSLRTMRADGSASTELLRWDWERRAHGKVDPRGELLLYSEVRRWVPQATRLRDLETGEEVDLPVALDRPIWSPGGDRIAGVADGRIVVCDRGGEGCEALTEGSRPGWSAEGTTVYFGRPSSRPGHLEVWSRDLEEGTESRIAEIGPIRFIDLHFDVSPASNEIVFATQEQGRRELWITRLE